jgi:hypothetical protein
MLLKYDIMVFTPLLVGLLIGFSLGAGLTDALVISLAVGGVIVYGTLLVVYTWARLFNKEELLKELE